MPLTCVGGSQHPTDPTQVVFTVQYDVRERGITGRAVRVSDGCATDWYPLTENPPGSGSYQGTIPLGTCYRVDTEYKLQARANADSCECDYRTNGYARAKKRKMIVLAIVAAMAVATIAVFLIVSQMGR